MALSMSKFFPEELERWMQRIEIRRMWKCETPELSSQEMAELSKRFMHYALETCDYRFLNTALKLGDRLREMLPEADMEELNRLEQQALNELRRRLGL